MATEPADSDVADLRGQWFGRADGSLFTLCLVSLAVVGTEELLAEVFRVGGAVE